MPIRLFSPDPRWASRYEDLDSQLEQIGLELERLAELDHQEPGATWSEYAQAANGCVQGARSLLMTGNEARLAHIGKVVEAKSK